LVGDSIPLGRAAAIVHVSDEAAIPVSGAFSKVAEREDQECNVKAGSGTVGDRDPSDTP